jgi:hypothetical protein
VVVIHPNDYESTRGVPTPVQMLRMESLKKGKWAEPQGLSAIRDPVERARLRIEMQRQREEEEREILRAEEERQERIKREKQELLRREEEEAERRKAVIQAEALRVAAERRRREEEERIEEERKAREREEKKRVEKQKRIEEHLRLEEWRKTQQRLKEESTKAEEEARRREEEERKQKILQAKQELKTKARDGAMAGWVTIQTDESVVWRRRYFKFAPNSLYFYRSPEVRLVYAVAMMNADRLCAGHDAGSRETGHTGRGGCAEGARGGIRGPGGDTALVRHRVQRPAAVVDVCGL